MRTWTQEEVFVAPRPTNVVKWMLISTAVVFVAQLVVLNVLQLHGVNQYFALSRAGIGRGWVWQFVTYMFLHSTSTLWHIVGNMLGLYFLGPDVERAIGTRRFLLLYFGCGILGGAGWLLISGTGSATCAGASGAVLGIIGAFGGLYPRRRITLLLFLLIPVTLTGLGMAALWALVALVSLLISITGGVAHAAHLVGIVVGFIYAASLRRKYAAGLRDYPQGGYSSGPGIMSRLANRIRSSLARRGPRRPSQEEVDRVLDKVLQDGLNSLSRKEREILERESRWR